ncbi:hypothetical protein ABI59_10355 [Acidobacteria bacterium Mor1]|nr:hypothetical protein ABI59_10355 [Acidobacteria bacterium Mor1]
MPRRGYGLRILRRLRRLRESDLLVLHKFRLAPGEHGPVRRLARRILFDFDDAIQLRQPRRPGDPPETGGLRRKRMDRTVGMADLVFAGNEELAGYARGVASRVEVVPTGVDLERYPEEVPSRSGNTVVWIGRPENLAYLNAVHEALAAIAAARPAFRLRIVCSEFPDWNDVPIERVPWSTEGEIEALRSADIGIMPLADDPWTRAKCGFKLLQYMAAGLPCVASPVGVNREIVTTDCGFLCDDTEAWRRALQTLLESAGTRGAMGRSGRSRAAGHYAQRSIAAASAERIERFVAAAAGRG